MFTLPTTTQAKFLVVHTGKSQPCDMSGVHIAQDQALLQKFINFSFGFGFAAHGFRVSGTVVRLTVSTLTSVSLVQCCNAESREWA